MRARLLVLLLAFAMAACAGEAGPPGPQGPQGERGPAGADAPTLQGAGGQADQGLQGERVPTDAQEPQGAAAPGLQGERGSIGAPGSQGERGSIGVQGSQGERGPTGAQGPQGERGPTGAPGPPGAEGSTRTAGLPSTVYVFPESNAILLRIEDRMGGSSWIRRGRTNAGDAIFETTIPEGLVLYDRGQDTFELQVPESTSREDHIRTLTKLLVAIGYESGAADAVASAHAAQRSVYGKNDCLDATRQLYFMTRFEEQFGFRSTIASKGSPVWSSTYPCLR